MTDYTHLKKAIAEITEEDLDALSPSWAGIVKGVSHMLADLERVRGENEALSAVAKTDTELHLVSIRQLNALRTQVLDLKAALKPFSELWLAAQYSYEDEPDKLGFYGYNGTNITVGHLRTAARVLGDE